MSQTTTNVGRAQVAHPDRGYDTLDLGVNLHTALAVLYTFMSDHSMWRYYSLTLANGATSASLAHNFGLNLAKLKYLVFESAVQRTDAQVAADYVIAEVSANAITVQNVSGGSKTLWFCVLAGKLGVNSSDFDPAASIDIGGNIRASELRTLGNDLVLNHDAAGAGADWKATLRRPSTGMTADVVATLPAVTGTLATIAGVEQLTFKDIDGGTASNTSRLTVPKNTKANLDALTRKAGTIVFGTDTLIPYVDNGTVLSPIGSGGGGGGAVWSPDPDAAPSIAYLRGEKLLNFSFADAGTQKAVVWVKVPAGYVAGSLISIALGGYSVSTANTILLQATTYLVRKNTDAADSTTNSHPSANAALTNSVTAKKMREFVIPLTSSTGTINSVSVAAGDTLRVELVRGTDTDTADISMVPSSTEMRFS